MAARRADKGMVGCDGARRWTGTVGGANVLTRGDSRVSGRKIEGRKIEGRKIEGRKIEGVRRRGWTKHAGCPCGEGRRGL